MTTAANERLPTAFAVLVVHALLTQGAIFAVRPTISYQALAVGISPVGIGVLASLFALVPLIAALTFGSLSDRFGERALIVFGSVGMTLGTFALVLGGQEFGSLAISSVILGLSHLAVAVGQQAAIGRIVPRRRYAAAFGYYTVAGSVGQMFAPGLIIVYGSGREIPNTSAVFVGIFVLSVMASACSMLMPLGGRTSSDAFTRQTNRGMASLLGIRGFPTAVMVSGVALAAIDILTVYLPVLGSKQGYTASFVAWLLIVRAAVSAISRVFLESVNKSLGPKRVLAGTVLLGGVAMALLPLANSLAVLVFLMIALGFGLGVAQPVSMAWVSALAPVNQRGKAVSLRLTANRLAQTVVPLAASGATGLVGLSGVFVMVGAGLGAVAVLSSRLHVDLGSG